MDMCNPKKTSSKDNQESQVKDYHSMTIDELYKLVEYQKNHLIFLKDIGMLSNEEKG